MDRNPRPDQPTDLGVASRHPASAKRMLDLAILSIAPGQAAGRQTARHSTFAMRALGTIMMRTVLHYGWLIALAYLALYAVYFAITFTIYRRALRIDTADPVAVT